MNRKLVLLAAVASAGCTTLPDGSRWGDQATLRPEAARLGRAAARAALSPLTWVPAVAAGLVTIDGFDHEVADWAMRETPLFGSENGASNAGNHLLVAQAGLWAASALFTPADPGSPGWLEAKVKGLAVEGMGVAATNGVIEGLKRATNRVRPEDRGEHGVDAESFPSGHSGTAFSFATLTQRNLESMPIPAPARWGLSTGAYTLAGAVAWSRVETGKHYPSDVLAGAAIGHFVSAFIHDAFLGLPERKGWLVQAAPMDGGAVVDVSFSF